MSKNDKALLATMIREGRDDTYILRYLDCCKDTIRRYRKVFGDVSDE